MIIYINLLVGYNGTFAFEKPGDLYEDHNYIGMRIVCTAMGAALIPLRYYYYTDNSIYLVQHYSSNDINSF